MKFYRECNTELILTEDQKNTLCDNLSKYIKNLVKRALDGEMASNPIDVESVQGVKILGKMYFSIPSYYLRASHTARAGGALSEFTERCQNIINEVDHEKLVKEFGITFTQVELDVVNFNETDSECDLQTVFHLVSKSIIDVNTLKYLDLRFSSIEDAEKVKNILQEQLDLCLHLTASDLADKERGSMIIETLKRWSGELSGIQTSLVYTADNNIVFALDKSIISVLDSEILKSDEEAISMLVEYIEAFIPQTDKLLTIREESEFIPISDKDNYFTDISLFEF